ncbi:MAG: TetR/AcrR family transcriptional regulator [Lachnospiraceae bacterium]|nr:TetR/AcrR family transcriptional regulator [Lachnospiraceae bacterium]
MAVEDTKRKLIEATYEIMKNEGVDKVSARNIAKKAECTATVIYKYFTNLNYLVVMASLRFLEGYTKEGLEISLSKEDGITIDKRAWKAFINYAFRNPRIYENLFWGEGNEVYADAIVEYFELYPGEMSKRTTAYYYTMMFNPRIEERDFIWLRKSVNEGRMKMEDAFYVSRTNSYIVRGMLLEHMNDYKNPAVVEKVIEDCYSMIVKTIDSFIIE